MIIIPGLYIHLLWLQPTIPVCFILGTNFLAANNLELGFSCDVVSQILADKTKLNCMSTRNVDVVRNFDVMSFLGSMSVDQVDSGEITDSEISSDNYNIVVSRDDMIIMQNSNYAIKQLKKNVLNKVQPTLWKQCY